MDMQLFRLNICIMKTMTLLFVIVWSVIAWIILTHSKWIISFKMSSITSIQCCKWTTLNELNFQVAQLISLFFLFASCAYFNLITLNFFFAIFSAILILSVRKITVSTLIRLLLHYRNWSEHVGKQTIAFYGLPYCESARTGSTGKHNKNPHTKQSDQHKIEGDRTNGWKCRDLGLHNNMYNNNRADPRMYIELETTTRKQIKLWKVVERRGLQLRRTTKRGISEEWQWKRTKLKQLYQARDKYAYSSFFVIETKCKHSRVFIRAVRG